MSREEFCHFLSGRCVYTADGGTVTEIAGGDAPFYQNGWRGTGRVLETVRKTYMIRRLGVAREYLGSDRPDCFSKMRPAGKC